MGFLSFNIYLVIGQEIKNCFWWYTLHFGLFLNTKLCTLGYGGNLDSSQIVKDGQLFLKNNILDKGKTIKYFTQNIKDFGWLSSNPKSFGNVYFKSFWLVGGETIGFVHLGQKVTFGMQLEEREAAKLIGLIRKHFKK